MDSLVQDSCGESFEGAAGFERANSIAVEEDVRPCCEQAGCEVVNRIFAVAVIDQDLLSVDEERLAAIASLFRDRGFAAAILNGDAASALTGAYGGADEVSCGDV